MTHAQLISRMEGRGIPTSPFMHYWELPELLRYFTKHASSV